MKNSMMFGLLAFALMASAASATDSGQSSDHDLYVRTGGCLRYTIDTGGLMVNTYPQASFEDYQEMEFLEFASRYYINYEPVDCPKVNGIAVCA